MKRLALLVATAGGAGYSPFAPGTAGSVVGLVVFLLTNHWPLLWQAGLALLITAVGVWASSVAAVHFQREDPGYVVVDEVAGQLFSLFATGVGIPGAIIGFFVFRVFDVIKPWPANRAEGLPGGWGIMADDLVAGVYANLVVMLLVRVLPWRL